MGFQQYNIGPLSIVVYAALGYTVSADKIYTALGLFSALQEPASDLANVLTDLMHFNVSFKRINEFLLAEEMLANEAPTMRALSDSKTDTAIVLD
eukprot:jgi/Hompol1/2889/HPOL_006256-RA